MHLALLAHRSQLAALTPTLCTFLSMTQQGHLYFVRWVYECGQKPVGTIPQS